MEQAFKVIAELKEKLREYEVKFMQDNLIMREATTATGGSSE